MKKTLCIFLISVLFFCVQTAFSQTESSDEYYDDTDSGEVMTLEEIVIEVAPELPTVVVTIKRQEPEFKRFGLNDPLKRLIEVERELVKPDLTKMKASKIKDHEKLLATARNR